MLKEAIQYVLENMRPEAQNLGNRAYIITQKSAQEVIETPIAPDTVPLHSLDSIVKMIRTEAIHLADVNIVSWLTMSAQNASLMTCFVPLSATPIVFPMKRGCALMRRLMTLKRRRQ